MDDVYFGTGSAFPRGEFAAFPADVLVEWVGCVVDGGLTTCASVRVARFLALIYFLILFFNPRGKELFLPHPKSVICRYNRSSLAQQEICDYRQLVCVGEWWAGSISLFFCTGAG